MLTPATQQDLEFRAGRIHVRHIGESGSGELASACDQFQSGTHAIAHVIAHACQIGTGRMRLKAHQLQVRLCSAHASFQPRTPNLALRLVLALLKRLTGLYC